MTWADIWENWGDMSALLLQRFPELDLEHIGFCEARREDVALHLADMHDLTLSEAETVLEEWFVSVAMPKLSKARAA